MLLIKTRHIARLIFFYCQVKIIILKLINKDKERERGGWKKSDE